MILDLRKADRLHSNLVHDLQFIRCGISNSRAGNSVPPKEGPESRVFVCEVVLKYTVWTQGCE